MKFFDTLLGHIPKDSDLVGLKWKLYICILKMLHLRGIALRMIGRNEAILIVFIVSRISYEGWYFFFLLHLVASRQKMFTHCCFQLQTTDSRFERGPRRQPPRHEVEGLSSYMIMSFKTEQLTLPTIFQVMAQSSPISSQNEREFIFLND